MNYGMVKRMYNINEKFLYEILDDYKEAKSPTDKDDILNSFMKLIWASGNKRRTFKKDVSFKVAKNLIDTDIGKVFNTYSCISYMSYRSMTKETDFASLVRQKVNNIYTNMCDKNVCTKKEYMNLIKKPKQMYFRWVSGEEYSADELTDILDTLFEDIENTKDRLSKQKMDISWSEYKKIIAPFFRRMFENFIPLEKYEDKTNLTLHIDMWNEDNFAISYLCKGLAGYMKNYQKEYYNLPRNKKYQYCKCGGLFVQNKKNNKFKCDKCGSYQPIGEKIIKCIDCGKDVEVNVKDTHTMRCKNCQEIHKRELKKLEMQRYRARKNSL